MPIGAFRRLHLIAWAFRLVLAKARGTGNLSGWINVVSVRIDVGADGKVAGLF
jgi:hypothetical protein